jgi:hypothetical protein
VYGIAGIDFCATKNSESLRYPCLAKHFRYVMAKKQGARIPYAGGLLLV